MPAWALICFGPCSQHQVIGASLSWVSQSTWSGFVAPIEPRKSSMLFPHSHPRQGVASFFVLQVLYTNIYKWMVFRSPPWEHPWLHPLYPCIYHLPILSADISGISIPLSRAVRVPPHLPLVYLGVTVSRVPLLSPTVSPQENGGLPNRIWSFVEGVNGVTKLLYEYDSDITSNLRKGCLKMSSLTNQNRFHEENYDWPASLGLGALYFANTPIMEHVSPARVIFSR